VIGHPNGQEGAFGITRGFPAKKWFSLCISVIDQLSVIVRQLDIGLVDFFVRVYGPRYA